MAQIFPCLPLVVLTVLGCRTGFTGYFPGGSLVMQTSVLCALSMLIQVCAGL